MAVNVMVVMVMVVMVMVVKMMIEKRGLMEWMQYEKFASFSNSILHTVTLAYKSHECSLMGKLYGRPS
jgi:dihydrofolate reductase